MFEGILIILLFIGVALISRSVTTFVHEMGHAIPSLFFTKEEVIVCVGSYGDVSHSLRIKTWEVKGLSEIQFSFLEFRALFSSGHWWFLEIYDCDRWWPCC